MGELIHVEAAERPIAFNGERMTSDISGQVEIEHYHRYLLARDFCVNRDILDVASGEGYGTALLAQVARSAVGVELDNATVETAQREFRRQNLHYQQGNACLLPLQENSFDVVVSFETIEHLHNQDAFLSEVIRVLRPGGLFIVSTPDRDVYSPVGTPPNPFHVLELTREEFETHLRKKFAQVELVTQRPMIGSAILGARSEVAPRVFERRGEKHIEANFGMPRSPYLIAFASDAQLPLLPHSLYVHRSDLDTDPQVRDQAERRALALAGELEAVQGNVIASRLELDRLDAELQKACTSQSELEKVQAKLTHAEDERSAWETASRAAATEIENLTAALQSRKALQNELESIRTKLAEVETDGAAWKAKYGVAEQHLGRFQAELNRVRAVLAASQSRVGRTEDRALRNEALVQTLQDQASALAVEARNLGQALDSARRQMDQIWLEKEAERLYAEALQRELTREHKEAQGIREQFDAIAKSTVWRSTYHLRSFGDRHPKVARLARRTAKAAWWTSTFQLNRKLKARRYQLTSTVLDEQLLDPSTLAIQVFDMVPETFAAKSERVIEAQRETIYLETSGRPTVSIIIPTYGQVDYTISCLASIGAYPPRAAIEVIVMDDAFPGSETKRLEIEVQGIRLIRNGENLGFLLNCNKAARNASGEYLLFLNNDTEVKHGAIDALADLLDADESIGMVGSKLLFSDGRLQEAGGIIWDDASGWNWGRGEDPNRPEFNYRREVDYISGAAIMVRRSVFEKLGGFDEDFAPAYYEDTDLAFRIQELGLKVVYQPRSVVVHHEGVSHGTDVRTGIKTHQLLNADRMRTRWKETLERDHFPSGHQILRARDRARHKKVILVADHYVPEPDRDAGSRSIMGIMTSLLDAGWVVKFWPHNRAYSHTYTVFLEDLGIEVIDHRQPDDFVTWLKQNGNTLDHILLVRPSVAADLLVAVMTFTHAKLAFYGVDLHFSRMRREALVTGNVILEGEAKDMERFETRLWRQFDTVIYPSEEEAAIVRRLAPGTNAFGIVPFCYDEFIPRSIATKSKTILFVAGFAHPPNVDAAIFLVRDIIPLVRAHCPDVKVALVGSHPSEAVRSLAGDQVEVVGWVSEERLEQYYDESRVAVVPLRFGAGVKGKVVEALSRGLPLVTTPIGAEGIPGLASMIPTQLNPIDIAAALIRLLDDDDAWMAQASLQTSFAEANFSKKAVQKSVLKALST